MPDWVLLVVAGVYGVGAAVMCVWPAWERHRGRRAARELFAGWWNVVDLDDFDRDEQDR